AVRMESMRINLITVCQFYKISKIHNCNTVGNIFYYIQVVSNKHIGKSMLILKFLQQIDNLALNGNVQSRNRLVADDKFRFYRQSPGNTDTLPLTSGKLMRKTVGMFSVEAYCLQQFIDSLGPFFLVVHFMDLHTL